MNTNLSIGSLKVKIRYRNIQKRSVQEVVKQAAQKAKINKRVTPHTLRHCYATHLVDAGTQLPYIKNYWDIKISRRQ